MIPNKSERKLLRETRRRLGLSLYKLSDALGVEPSTISRIETGKIGRTSDALMREWLAFLKREEAKQQRALERARRIG